MRERAGKRIFATVLASMMLVTLVPISAMADN